MVLAHSRVTSQGQISVPAEVRRKLGLEPGATLEWEEVNGRIVVRRAGRFTFGDIRAALFPDNAPVQKSAAELKQGVAKYLRRKHARR
jgi:AbrB family looped-hinge helix DNA binding protein